MITTNEVPAIPKKAINEITFLLYNYNDLEQIEHAYALTIHKSQRK